MASADTPAVQSWLRRIHGVFTVDESGRLANWPVPLEPLEMPRMTYATEDLLVAFELPQRSKWTEQAGGRYVVPNRVDAIVDKSELPRCQLRIEVEGGKPVCTQLTLLRRPGEPPLRTERIRIHLDKLVREIALFVGGKLVKTDPAEIAKLRPEPGKRLPEEVLQEVARVYRYALERGLPPTKAVGDALNVSRSTAGRYVVRARRAGQLGPASPGVAGELEPEGGNDG